MEIFFLRSNPVNPDPRVEKQAIALKQKNYKITILGWDRTNDKTTVTKLNLNGYNIPIIRAGIRSEFGSGLKNIIPLFVFQFFLLRVLISKRKGYTVIHAADFDTVLPAMLMRLFFKKKVVYDIYDFYVDAFTVPNFAKKFIRWLDFKVINTADAVIITNESRFEQIKGSNPKNLYVIHNSPSDMQYTFVEKESKHEITVTYVGILQSSRLLEEIIEVFIENPQWNLKLAGFGLLENHIREIASQHSNIEFYGKVSYEQGILLSSQADILFATYDPSIPNHKYTSPNKLYEAMMLSKPIIVCKNTGIDSLVSKKKIGIVINYSKKEFMYALNYFSKMSNAEYLVMSTQARILYDEKYSWNKMIDVLHNIYNHLEQV